MELKKLVLPTLAILAVTVTYVSIAYSQETTPILDGRGKLPIDGLFPDY